MKFLLDSNLIIYHLNGCGLATAFLQENINMFAISDITRIEVLGFAFPSVADEVAAHEIVSAIVAYPIDNQIIEQTIFLRKRHKIKVPDAIIAVTAISRSITLATNNINDFSGISGLKIINPLT